MITPTAAQLAAANVAARLAIKNYSSFYSGMVPDDALQTVVDKALIAALNVQPLKGSK